MRNCFTYIVILMFPVLLSAGNITFMTYNLQNDNGLNFQSLRITRHAQVITASNADVVSVQEVNGNTNFNNLKSRSGLAGSWYDIAGNGYGIGVLWKSSLGTPIITNVKVNPTPGSTDKESRAYIIAEFADFSFISTHYSLNAVDRDTMTARIIAYANRAGKTVFVGGDFNAQPTYRAMVTFKNNNFVILNNLSENTYPSSAPTSLIDMVLGFRKNTTDKQYSLVSAGIPTPPTGVVLKDISDHLPYCVTVNLTDGPGTGTDIPENNNIRVYTKDRTILIDAPDTPLDIKVYNLPGNLVREETGFGQHTISLEGIAGNVFIVKVNGRGVKVVVPF